MLVLGFLHIANIHVHVQTHYDSVELVREYIYAAIKTINRHTNTLTQLTHMTVHN